MPRSLLTILLAGAAVALAAAPATARETRAKYRVEAATIKQTFTYSYATADESMSASETATLHARRSPWRHSGAVVARLTGPVQVHTEGITHGVPIPPCDLHFDAGELETDLQVSWNDRRRKAPIHLGLQNIGFDDHRVCGDRSPRGVLAGGWTGRIDTPRLGRDRVVDVRPRSFTVQSSGSHQVEMAAPGFTGTYTWVATIRIKRR